MLYYKYQQQKHNYCFGTVDLSYRLSQYNERDKQMQGLSPLVECEKLYFRIRRKLIEMALLPKSMVKSEPRQNGTNARKIQVPIK